MTRATTPLTPSDIENVSEVLDSQLRLGHDLTLVPTDVLARLLDAARLQGDPGPREEHKRLTGVDLPQGWPCPTCSQSLRERAALAASSEGPGQGDPGLRKTPDFMAADRALAVAHREDDQPCGCDDCMSYGADDEGFDWYKVSPARRIVLRVLDSGDDRLALLATAFKEHEEALAASSEGPGLDVERLARAMEASRHAIEKAGSVGLRYRAIHDDVLCARDEHGCGCLCHAADVIATVYARLASEPAEQEDGA